MTREDCIFLFRHVRDIQKGNYNLVARGAAKGGNMDMVEYVFTKAPKNYEWEYTWIAYAAVEGGNKDIIEYVFTKAPKDYEWGYNSIAREAAKKEIRILLNMYSQRHQRIMYGDMIGL